MKSITDTFIVVAEDCPTQVGIIPPQRENNQTLARLHYDLLVEHPYEFDIDALNFEVYCRRNNIPDAERESHRPGFFSKGHPCMRASPLTKNYGYGAHYNSAGKIAVYPVDSIAYGKLARDPDIRVEKAMRNRKAPHTSGTQAA